MWWTQGVAGAVAACQERKSVLLVLVEPPFDVFVKRSDVPETSQRILSRVATLTMHRTTFSDAAILQLVSDSEAVCLRFPSEETNEDYKAFSVYFKLSGIPPNMYFISPLTGQTLLQKPGFVSAKDFTHALTETTKMVSGKVISIRPVKQRRKQTSQVSKLDIRALLNNPGPEFELSEEEADDPQDDAEVSTSVTDNTEEQSKSPQAVESLPTSSKSMKLSTSQSSGSREESRLLGRLPSGSQIRKTFTSSTKFSVVRSWLSDEAKAPSKAILIATAFPRRVFDQAEDPKMLSELGLVPSETLIVSVLDDLINSESNSRAGPSAAGYGLRSYAAGALRVIGGFLKSFVADNPNASPEGQEQNGAASNSSSFGTTGRSQGPRAMRLQRTEPDDDENLLSNGNSTQYGWNPQDMEDEERRS